MKVLIGGGTGFLGRSLAKSILADGHEAVVLTRRAPSDARQVQWDGRTTNGCGHIVNEVDAVVHLTVTDWNIGPGRIVRRKDSRIPASFPPLHLLLPSRRRRAAQAFSCIIPASTITDYEVTP